MFDDSREAIRRAVSREVKEFGEAFDALREECPALGHFSSAEELLAFLGGRDAGAVAEKNAALHALICRAQAADALGERAKTLLLAAMWPGLDHSYFRVLSQLEGTEDPFAEVYWAFLEEVQGWNPGKRDFVALNLQRNTERRVRNAVRRERKYQAACGHLREVGRRLGTHRLWAAAGSGWEDRPDEGVKADAEALLAELVGRDVISIEESLLIVGHALYGRELRDIAAEQGVRYRALSKRYQRAVGKVRKALGRAEDFPQKVVSPENRNCPFLSRKDRGPAAENGPGPEGDDR
jgi:DNA-directed RNA polymerase specialized sigma24 family protein